MQVHLVDGTYELFRHYYAPRVGSHVNARGEEVGATRAVVGSVLGLVENGATHLGIATDHVIESFRNDMWATYKTGEGVEPELKAQFPLLEEALAAAGFVVWAMVDQEADDAIGAASVRASADPRVDEVVICTPDKDMAQLVGGNVVQVDRMRDKRYDTDAVVEKFGVPPASIADWLALVGDSADGFPGLPGWGAKSAAVVLARYGTIEAIPADPETWDVKVRGAAKLAATLVAERDHALLFKDLATLRTDHPVFDDVDELRWTGPSDPAAWAAVVERLDGDALAERVARLSG